MNTLKKISILIIIFFFFCKSNYFLENRKEKDIFFNKRFCVNLKWHERGDCFHSSLIHGSANYDFIKRNLYFKGAIRYYYYLKRINKSCSFKNIKRNKSIIFVKQNFCNKRAAAEYENKVLKKKMLIVVCFSVCSGSFLLVIFILRYLQYKKKELFFLMMQQKNKEEICLLLAQEQKKIQTAKETEKAKIAKELHDGVLNKIYGVRMNLGFFNARTETAIINKRSQYISELQNIENEIRMISHGLSQSSYFDDNDFNFLLLNLVEKQQNFGDTNFIYEINPLIEWAPIQYIYKVNLYRIVQEGIFNVVKYANAKNCFIKITVKSNVFLELEIKDDGNGFDVKQKKKGIGLINLKERVKALKGHFKIQSKIGIGTKINVLLRVS